MSCGSCQSSCNEPGSQNGLEGVPFEGGVRWQAASAEFRVGEHLPVAHQGLSADQQARLQVESQQAKEHINHIFHTVGQRRIPFWAHLDLTYACNTDCVHCYCQNLDPSFGGKHHGKDLTTREVFRLLDELAEAGALHLTLSGGELFLRKDFFDIAFYASREKHFALKVYTNGTIMTERMADRLLKLGPVVVEISLQGATAEVHDRIVQQPGSFDRVVKTVGMLRRRGLNVVLKTTIMKPNYDQADAIFHLAQELGATNYRTTIEVTPRNDGNPDVQVHQLSDEQMLDYLLSAGVETPTYQAPVAPEQAREKGTCGTGTVACYISPYGDVYPCIQLLISMGNIRERSFREIWEAPSALRTKIESIQRYGDLPDCRTCEYVQFCQRCHGLAYLETGDFTKCYKLALRTAKISKQVNAAVGLRRHATITTTGG